MSQWLAASAAGLPEIEYVAFGDDCHGGVVAKFVSDMIALQPDSRTV
jgi:hypothetical protein